MKAKRYPPEGFAKRLNNTILEAGDSYRTAAKKIGVGNSSMEGYVHGDTTPSITIFMKMCEVYHVTADYLLYGKEATDEH